MKNIYLFIGDEKVIIENKIRNIIAEANPGEFNLNSYDMEETPMADVLADANTAPFISKRKVVIMKRPIFLSKASDPKDMELLENYINSPSQTTTLIIDASLVSVDNRKSIVKILKSKVEVSDTKNLSEIEMKGWLKRQIEKEEKYIDEKAISKFFEFVGYDLQKAKTEVSKLINYLGDEAYVKVADIEKVVTDVGGTNVFDLTNAIINKDKKRIMTIYYGLLKNGYEQLQLLSLIFRTIKNMYLTQHLLGHEKTQQEIASFFKCNPNRVYYLKKDASKFKPEQLEDILIRIGELDFAIKTGKTNKKIGMEMFLFGL